ncbi:hypothetical protein FRC01_007154 [Tulasnella sp. 417]|nr:hypothetical protein FRC01_007154 [Tulasnella sp. 417]
MRSSTSSLGDLTIKPLGHGGRECGEMDPKSDQVLESPDSRSGHPLPEPTPNPLISRADFGSFEHADIKPGRPTHPFGVNDSDRPAIPPSSPSPSRKLFISPVSELEPASLLLRRVSSRRVSQEPAPSLPAIAEVSMTFSSPPASPSVKSSPNQEPTQPSGALPSGSRSTTWTFAQEQDKAAKIPSLQLGHSLPGRINAGSRADDSKQSMPDEQRDLRLQYILKHWEDIPNSISTEDWVKTASAGTLDLKSVYDMVDRQEIEEILDFAHYSRFIMDLEHSAQPGLTLGSVFGASRYVTIAKGNLTANASHRPIPPSLPQSQWPTVTQPLGTPNRDFGWQPARGWPYRAPSGSQEGRHNSAASNKFSIPSNQLRHPAPTSTHSYQRPYSAALPNLHTSSSLHNQTTASKRGTASHPTTASTLLQSIQSQAQIHPSTLLPIPLLSEVPQVDYYPYSSYTYSPAHPYFDQPLLEHHQQSSSCGPRFLALRHSDIHRYH